jgi:hypothetical protein
MWEELLQNEALRKFTDEASLGENAFAFELYGNRNPHLVTYKDVSLSTRLLFAVSQSDATVRPASDIKSCPEWTLTPEAVLDSPQALISFYEDKRAEAESKNTVIGEGLEKQVEGTEGFIFYTLDETGHWDLWKCKPESVETLHWAQGSIPAPVLVATAWNALESCPDPELTPEYVRGLLLEEFTAAQVGRSDVRIGKTVAYINNRIQFRQKVKDAYTSCGADWIVDGRAQVMRAISKSFDRKEMKKVFQALQEIGVAK